MKVKAPTPVDNVINALESRSHYLQEMARLAALFGEQEERKENLPNMIDAEQKIQFITEQVDEVVDSIKRIDAEAENRVELLADYWDAEKCSRAQVSSDLEKIRIAAEKCDELAAEALGL